MAHLLHEQEPLIRFEEVVESQGADLCETTSSTQEQEPNSTVIQHVCPEKDKEHRAVELKQHIRIAILKWHLQANVMDNVIADTKDIQELKRQRNILNDLFSELTRYGIQYQQFGPSDYATHSKIEFIEKEHRVISRCLSDTIVSLQSECERAKPQLNNQNSHQAKARLQQAKPASSANLLDVEASSFGRATEHGNVSCDSTSRLMDTILQQTSLSRLPLLEPTVFSGDALAYNSWKTSFDLLIDQKPISAAEKLHYLERYLNGPARECIEGFLIQPNPNSYSEAREILDQRYGNSFFIANAFRQKLLNWPHIPPYDGEALQRLSDFLSQCNSAMETNRDMFFLNDPIQCQPLLKKLPEETLTRWILKVDEYRNSPEAKRSKQHVSSSYPPFNVFVSFIEHQTHLACDPIFAFRTIRTQTNSNSSTSFATRGIETVGVQRKPAYPPCLICEEHHWLGLCPEFRKKRIIERHEFAKKKGLCFNCLESQHLAKDCASNHRCRLCNDKHSTFLHFIERQDPGQNEDRVNSEHARDSCPVMNHSTSTPGDSKSSMIVPVYVSSVSDSGNEVLTYALLDTQSDATFVTTNVSDKLQVKGKRITIPLTTMLSEEETESEELTGLRVRGLNRTEVVAIKKAFTRSSLQGNRNHIPTADAARTWQHLSQLADELPLPQCCDIGMLIGYDCAHALTPRKVVSSDARDAPFAVLTDLGWSIVGLMDVNRNNAMCMCHRVFHQRRKKR